MSSSYKQKKMKTLATRKKTRKRRIEEGMTFEDDSGRLFQPPSVRDPRWKKPSADAIVTSIAKKRRKDDDIEVVQQESSDDDSDESEAEAEAVELPKTSLRLCSSLEDVAANVMAKHAAIRRKDGRQKTKVLLLVDTRSIFKLLKKKMNIRQEMVKAKSRLGVGSGKKPEMAFRNTGFVKTPLERFKDVNQAALAGYKSGKLSTILAEDLSFYPYSDLKVQHVLFAAKSAASAINLDRNVLQGVEIHTFVLNDQAFPIPSDDRAKLQELFNVTA